MWIPRSLYEVLPYAYMVAGAAALAAAFVGDRGPRSLLMLLGVLGLTVGLVLWMRRREYRENQSEYDSKSLDD
jgi:Flp pilus assembly protein TadB